MVRAAYAYPIVGVGPGAPTYRSTIGAIAHSTRHERACSWAPLSVAGKKARLSDSGVRERVARQPLGAALTYS